MTFSGLSAQGADHLGSEVERLKRVSALDAGNGALIISIRSEIYLDEPLDLFFLREGGDVANESDVIRLTRKQNQLAFTNSTTKYKVRAYQLRAGTYRLIAHGMDCPKIPAEDERCLSDVSGLLLGKLVLGRPSRGYGEEAPSFEIRAGQVTYAGDFALTSRNRVEWSQIPQEELGRSERAVKGLARGPEPVVPEGFELKYGLFPRSFETDAKRRY
ncbi:hypothetical protein INR77_09555 [Erythrobacter sp. SCSIO 43205]|uniref:hypothetical protein n=1 Tax=Erythrobacter sp. SCSIO 43205 TaxID=2779361 RepID=UPI001CA9B7F1|nr:hypothetical protein [Erythrobacter sp. SCSIO 43205]UAB77080.1 hypothetical protein INR77_09555 [Erythrobacter sp. SCSIO 43205]